MNILFIIHADFEMPGIIESWAKENRFTYRICRPFAGETLPTVADFDWLIVMGGPQSPRDAKTARYLQDEIDLITRALIADKTILGFCLGAQLIGEALGAKTEKSPYKEVGFFPITLTQEGKSDPLLKHLPPEFPVMHWHNDMPGLTPHSKVLAASLGCPRQIVRYSPRVYGFQCHLEPTLHNIKEMIAHCKTDLEPGRFVQSEAELLQGDFFTLNSRMVSILNCLLFSDSLVT